MNRILIALLVFLSPLTCFANDSISSVTQSGIELLKTDNIRMKKEHLTVTPNKIKIDYEFYNDSDKDITTEVAFPMPEIGTGDYDNHDKFNDFSVTVDGKKIKYDSKSRAFTTVITADNQEPSDFAPAGNVWRTDDVTDELKKYDMPLDRFIEAKDLKPELLEKLKLLKLYSDENPGEEMAPAYGLQITHYWLQTFPAHQSLKVSHEYTPRLGMNSVGAINFEKKWFGIYPETQMWSCYSRPDLIELDHKTNDPCIKAFKDGHFEMGKYGASYVDYIISTGSNWKNGIEDFHLTVDGSAYFYVEMDGKVDADIGHKDFYVKNFKPKKELLVEFVGMDQAAKLPPGAVLTKKIDGPANCRDKIDGKVTFSVPDGETVNILEKSDNWYKINYKNSIGWTSEKNFKQFPNHSPNEDERH